MGKEAQKQLKAKLSEYKNRINELSDEGKRFSKLFAECKKYPSSLLESVGPNNQKERDEAIKKLYFLKVMAERIVKQHLLELVAINESLIHIMNPGSLDVLYLEPSAPGINLEDLEADDQQLIMAVRIAITHFTGESETEKGDIVAKFLSEKITSKVTDAIKAGIDEGRLPTPETIEVQLELQKQSEGVFERLSKAKKEFELLLKGMVNLSGRDEAIQLDAERLNKDKYKQRIEKITQELRGAISDADKLIRNIQQLKVSVDVVALQALLSNIPALPGGADILTVSKEEMVRIISSTVQAVNKENPEILPDRDDRVKALKQQLKPIKAELKRIMDEFIEFAKSPDGKTFVEMLSGSKDLIKKIKEKENLSSEDVQKILSLKALLEGKISHYISEYIRLFGIGEKIAHKLQQEEIEEKHSIEGKVEYIKTGYKYRNDFEEIIKNVKEKNEKELPSVMLGELLHLKYLIDKTYENNKDKLKQEEVKEQKETEKKARATFIAPSEEKLPAPPTVKPALTSPQLAPSGIEEKADTGVEVKSVVGKKPEREFKRGKVAKARLTEAEKQANKLSDEMSKLEELGHALEDIRNVYEKLIKYGFIVDKDRTQVIIGDDDKSKFEIAQLINQYTPVISEVKKRLSSIDKTKLSPQDLAAFNYVEEEFKKIPTIVNSTTGERKDISEVPTADMVAIIIKAIIANREKVMLERARKKPVETPSTAPASPQLAVSSAPVESHAAPLSPVVQEPAAQAEFLRELEDALKDLKKIRLPYQSINREAISRAKSDVAIKSIKGVVEVYLKAIKKYPALIAKCQSVSLTPEMDELRDQIQAHLDKVPTLIDGRKISDSSVTAELAANDILAKLAGGYELETAFNKMRALTPNEIGQFLINLKEWSVKFAGANSDSAWKELLKAMPENIKSIFELFRNVDERILSAIKEQRRKSSVGMDEIGLAWTHFLEFNQKRLDLKPRDLDQLLTKLQFLSESVNKYLSDEVGGSLRIFEHVENHLKAAFNLDELFGLDTSVIKQNEAKIKAIEADYQAQITLLELMPESDVEKKAIQTNITILVKERQEKLAPLNKEDKRLTELKDQPLKESQAKLADAVLTSTQATLIEHLKTVASNLKSKHEEYQGYISRKRTDFSVDDAKLKADIGKLVVNYKQAIDAAKKVLEECKDFELSKQALASKSTIESYLRMIPTIRDGRSISDSDVVLKDITEHVMSVIVVNQRAVKSRIPEKKKTAISPKPEEAPPTPPLASKEVKGSPQLDVTDTTSASKIMSDKVLSEAHLTLAGLNLAYNKLMMEGVIFDIVQDGYIKLTDVPNPKEKIKAFIEGYIKEINRAQRILELSKDISNTKKGLLQAAYQNVHSYFKSDVNLGANNEEFIKEVVENIFALAERGGHPSSESKPKEESFTLTSKEAELFPDSTPESESKSLKADQAVAAVMKQRGLVGSEEARLELFRQYREGGIVAPKTLAPIAVDDSPSAPSLLERASSAIFGTKIEYDSGLRKYTRQELLGTVKLSSDPEESVYLKQVVGNQFYELGSEGFYDFRSNVSRRDLVNGLLYLGSTKQGFEDLSDERVIARVMAALDVDRQTAINVMHAHSQGPQGLIPFITDGCFKESLSDRNFLIGTPPLKLGPDGRPTDDQPRQFNIKKDSKGQIKFECEFEYLPLKRKSDEAEMGRTGPVKAVFRLAQNSKGGWGYELEYIATNDSLIIDAFIGKTFTASEVLSRIHTKHPKPISIKSAPPAPPAPPAAPQLAPVIPEAEVVKAALAEMQMPVDVVGSVVPEVDKMLNLQSILAKMRQLEIDKYPPHKYEYKQFMLDNGMRVSYVKHTGESLTHHELSDMKANALALRKLSIIAGVIYMLGVSSHYLTQDANQRQKIIARLIQIANGIQAGQPQESINKFIDKLVAEIGAELPPSASKEQDIIRFVRNAERYFIAEYNSDRLLVSETQTPTGPIVQLDVPYGNKLSKKQKQEYLRIHDAANQPLWFKELPQWEKDWLLKKVPKAIADDWTSFERLYISSAMQHIPGLKNARQNFLYKKTAAGHTKLSSTFKMSTMVPYEMPKSERERITEMNAGQALMEVRQGAQLILFNSLLNDVKVRGVVDIAITKGQVAAVKSAAAGDPMVMSGNDSTNMGRYLIPFTKDPEHLGRWEHVENLLAFYEANPALHNSLADAAVQNLRILKDKSILPALLSRRNFMAHKAAYVGILVEALGGKTLTSCKSGKDRTFLDEAYRAAMLIYFEQNGRLPGFDDDDVQRKAFVDIFVPIFNSMIGQEAAALNTPGSFGIIDNAKVLCGDIQAALKTAYHVSIECANYNKPGKFRKDEAHAAAARKERDKTLAAAQPAPASVPVPPKPPIVGMRYYGKDAKVTATKEEAEDAVNQYLQTQANPKGPLGALTGSASDKVTDYLKGTEARYILQEVVDQHNHDIIRTATVQSYDAAKQNCHSDLYGDLEKFKKVPRMKASSALIPRTDIPGLPVIQWAMAQIEEFQELKQDKEPIMIEQRMMPKVCVEALLLCAMVKGYEVRHDSKVEVKEKQVEYLRDVWGKWQAQHKTVIADIDLPALPKKPGQSSAP